MDTETETDTDTNTDTDIDTDTDTDTDTDNIIEEFTDWPDGLAPATIVARVAGEFLDDDVSSRHYAAVCTSGTVHFRSRGSPRMRAC